MPPKHKSSFAPARTLHATTNGSCTSAIWSGKPQLLGRAAGAKQKRAFAGIEAVGLEVYDVVPAVQQQAHRKTDVQRAKPETRGLKNIALAQRQHVKRNRREPQTGTGRLQQENRSRANRPSGSGRSPLNGREGCHSAAPPSHSRASMIS